MSDADIVIEHNRPLRLAVADGDLVWDDRVPVVRVRGDDLGDLARKSARVRRDRPDVEVVADIDVVIAAEAWAARAMMADDSSETQERTMLYVGTPTGLAGLVADIHALGIADGAVLIPRGAGVADLIREAVLPVLQTLTAAPAFGPQARPA
ncbi:hypothetical protein [Mycobacterium sp. shizuoka-1]|uniref:hypothetical protein n=1 Tax=Mycobacterium sp. shizuoka-1 TaxID=2039281 RepID=UPI000C064EDC|nr:hypothetical protein [Mycobacterium sp. shizuoka-1]GAY15562.1 hypothetical protein MSZK_22880 [Mycobacterium sp. shizuoka-1]